MFERESTACTAEQPIPAERLAPVRENNNRLLIGIPREVRPFEKRMSLTPEAIGQLCEWGHRVLVQSGAGDAIQYPDHRFSEMGAEIVDDVSSVWECDIVIKVSSPTMKEILMMKSKSTLISLVQLRHFSKEMLDLMAERKINAVAYDFITDSHGGYPIINQIREIEGRTAVVLAAHLLTIESGGKGILLGGCAGVSPTEVVILGTGHAGGEAARTATSFGALVKVFDNNIDGLRALQCSLGAATFTSTLHPKVLVNALRSADVVIGTLRIEQGEREFLLSEDMIRQMKRGALIIDMNVDQGGCFESSIYPKTKDEVLFEKYGVLHYCIPNISSCVARTTTISLSNHLFPILRDIAEAGTILNYLRERDSFRNGVYFYNGKLVNRTIGEYFDYKWNDINFFLPALQ